MGVIVLPQQFTSQPQYAGPLDGSIAEGLRGLWMPSDGGSALLRNRVTNKTATAITGSVTPGIAEPGRVLNFATGNVDTGDPVDIIGSEITIALRFRVVANFAYRLFGNHGAGTTGYLAFLNGNNGIEFHVNAVLAASTTIPIGAWTQVAFSASAGIKRIAVDGIVTETAGAVTLASQAQTVKLGAYNWAGFNDFTGYGEYFAVWERGLLSPELQRLQANPYSVYKAPPRRLFIAAAAGINLTGATSTQTNTASTPAVTQTHVITGSASAQGNAASTAPVTQAHALAGAAVNQANATSTGAVTQAHVLTGSASTQANTASTGAVSQGASFVGAACSQSNTSATGAITQTHVLAGQASAQSNASSTDAITQTHQLTASGSTQANEATGGAVSLGIAISLTAAASTQGNAGSSAAITQAHVLVCAPSVQDNVAASSAIVQSHILAAANSTQANASASGEIIIGVSSITSLVEKTAVFRATVARQAKFQRSKSVSVKFN